MLCVGTSEPGDSSDVVTSVTTEASDMVSSEVRCENFLGQLLLDRGYSTAPDQLFFNYKQGLGNYINQYQYYCNLDFEGPEYNIIKRFKEEHQIPPSISLSGVIEQNLQYLKSKVGLLDAGWFLKKAEELKQFAGY